MQQTPNPSFTYPSNGQNYYPTQAPMYPDPTQGAYTQTPGITSQVYDAKYQQTAQGQIIYPPLTAPQGVNFQDNNIPLATQYAPASFVNPYIPLEKQITGVNLPPASKFVCYIVPFPNLKVAIAPGRFTPNFMVYTQLAPPTPTPAPGEKEARLAKSKRKWEKSLADAKVKSGLKSKAILVCK
jgi:hypothetical protein